MGQPEQRNYPEDAELRSPRWRLDLDGTKNHRVTTLTQLIAVICEDGKTAVTVSDRMVSTGDMTLAFEHSRLKGEILTDNSVVLTAGTIHEPDLVRQAASECNGGRRQNSNH